MKAVILSATKETLPQFDPVAGQDVPTIVVKFDVQYQNDDGTVHSEQSYARRPQDLDAENPTAEFDRQAQVLQTEIEQRAANLPNEEANAAADAILSKITVNQSV